MEALAKARLFESLRDALVEVLSEGTWKEIKRNHARVGLPWREEFEPGHGKPKYVERVLRDLDDADVLSLTGRVLEMLDDRSLLSVEDAVWWVEAEGSSSLSNVTRRAVAATLDDHRLHPRRGAEDFVSDFARPAHERSKAFFYGEGNRLMAKVSDVYSLLMAQPSQPQTASHVELLESYGLTDWPDKRLGIFLNRLVHPEVRTGKEQQALVDALNEALRADGWRLDEVERLSGHPVFSARPIRRVVDGRPKNLIFAAKGPKPELGFSDAVNNDIVILKNREHCLIYSDPITEDGLLWSDLVNWWVKLATTELSQSDARKGLGKRLLAAISSPAEQQFFKAYFKRFREQLKGGLPALIPQVYLHFDPVTNKQLRSRGEGKRFPVQRMDFLMLLPDRVRVVLEVDGKQHYATGMHEGAYASPRVYANTMSADRRLQLIGYEVYRFGGYELRNEAVAAQTVKAFFNGLFRRHGIRTQ